MQIIDIGLRRIPIIACKSETIDILSSLDRRLAHAGETLSIEGGQRCPVLIAEI